MKGVRFIHLFALTLLILSCTGSATPPEEHGTGGLEAHGVQGQASTPSRPAGRKTEDGVFLEVLVKFKEGTEAQTIQAIQGALHLQTIRIIPGANLYLMKIQNGLSMEETIKRLQKSQAVEHAEANLVRTIP
jgi:hypothetical protein